jgi:hypothetical protein
MNKDLHNIEEYFKAAYKQLSEDPSPEVWEKINAGLDKKDAAAYKRRSKRWKQVAIFSLLLLSGFILKETNILRIGFSHSNKRILIAVKTTPSKVNGESREKTIDPKHSLPREPNSSAGKIINDAVAEGNKINPDALVTLNDPAGLPERTNKTGSTINHIRQEEGGHDQKEASVLQSASGNSEKNLLKPSAYSLNEIIIPSIEKKYHNEIAAGHLGYIPSLSVNNISGLPLKNKSKNGNPLEDQNKWNVSGFISSDRAGYRLDRDQTTIVKIREDEDHLPSFSAGVLLTRQIKKRFGLQTGIIYSNTAIAISPQKIYASQNQMGKVLYKYVTSSGNAYIKPNFASSPYPGDSLKAEHAQHNLQYIIAPLVFKYKLINSDKIILSPGLGLAANFLTNAKIETDVEGVANREHVVINKLEGIKTFNWSLMGDVWLDYRVNKKMSVSLRPSFSFALSPISSTDDVETFPYSFGLGAGVTYRF